MLVQRLHFTVVSLLISDSGCLLDLLFFFVLISQLLLSLSLRLLLPNLQLIQEVRNVCLPFRLHVLCHWVEEVVMLGLEGFLSLLLQVVGEPLCLKLFDLAFGLDYLSRLSSRQRFFLDRVLKESISRRLSISRWLDCIDITCADFFLRPKQCVDVVYISRVSNLWEDWVPIAWIFRKRCLNNGFLRTHWRLNFYL